MAFFIYEYFKNKIINIKIFSIGIIILIFLYLWYFEWSEYLRLNFGISDRFYGGDYKNFVINLTDINNYIMFIKVLHDNYVHFILLPFLILGIKKFFDLIEQNLNTKVIIATHPRSNYKNLKVRKILVL